MKIEKHITERGFKKIEFKDMYNYNCSIQESSNVEPSIWVGVSENRMILDKKMARKIGNMLLKFGYFGKI